jgi:sugar phosphate isomerase/epimerase
MKRRTFIMKSGAGMLAGMLMPRELFSMPAMNKPVGLQLYSLRDEIGKDLKGSLEKIAGIGYKHLEAAGYRDGKFYGLEPLEFKTIVESLGMKLTSSHLTFKNDEVSQVLKAHQELGVNYMVWPWLNQEQRSSISAYQDVAEKFNTIGKMCNDNGFKFGYHNHDFEFHPTEGKIPYDILLESTDPELVFMQIDLYWIIFAGKDPIAYFEKYPGRFETWHVKDMAEGESKEMTEVGTGIIDYGRIFKYAQTSGMKEFFIEQDVIKGDGFESVKASFDHISSII